jgi:iron(III) transport system substrate-binding protein
MIGIRLASTILRAALPVLMAGLSAGLIACGSDDTRPKVVIYTSIYENVIARLDPILREQFPDIRVEWFQSGSEKIAVKVNQEIAAGRVGADIIMTSDPFWYEELKLGGYLLSYASPGATEVPGALRDPDDAFATVRVPVVVLAVNAQRVKPEDRPRSFKDLTDPVWKGRISMGDPAASGSAFTAVAALTAKYGWEYFEALRANEVMAAGGNSSVLTRLNTGEREVGILLLENLLKEREENPASPAEIIYPEDGAILVPSPMAIFAATQYPEAARRIYDFFLTEAGQQAMVDGWMYSPIDRIAPPSGARPWNEIHDGALVPWSDEYLRDVTARRDEIKRRFHRIVFE